MLEKHLEAVRRDRDEALANAKSLLEQFKREIRFDLTPHQGQIEGEMETGEKLAVELDHENEGLDAPEVDKSKSVHLPRMWRALKEYAQLEVDLFATSWRSLPRGLGRPLRSPESSQGSKTTWKPRSPTVRLHSLVCPVSDAVEGKKVQDRLEDELAKKDRMVQDLTSTQ